MKKWQIIGVAVFGIFALLGVFFTGLVSHEYTHVVQSSGAVSVNYDLQQSTFGHVKHNIDAWETTNAFNSWVSQTEISADIVEQTTGFSAAFVLGGSVVYLMFGVKYEKTEVR